MAEPVDETTQQNVVSSLTCDTGSYEADYGDRDYDDSAQPCRDAAPPFAARAGQSLP
jgi:hypothetical protein